jgi:hypothetical protein
MEGVVGFEIVNEEHFPHDRCFRTVNRNESFLSIYNPTLSPPPLRSNFPATLACLWNVTWINKPLTTFSFSSVRLSWLYLISNIINMAAIRNDVFMNCKSQTWPKLENHLTGKLLNFIAHGLMARIPQSIYNLYCCEAISAFVCLGEKSRGAHPDRYNDVGHWPDYHVDPLHTSSTKWLWYFQFHMFQTIRLWASAVRLYVRKTLGLWY